MARDCHSTHAPSAHSIVKCVYVYFLLAKRFVCLCLRWCVCARSPIKCTQCMNVLVWEHLCVSVVACNVWRKNEKKEKWCLEYQRIEGCCCVCVFIVDIKTLFVSVRTKNYTETEWRLCAVFQMVLWLREWYSRSPISPIAHISVVGFFVDDT